MPTNQLIAVLHNASTPAEQLEALNACSQTPCMFFPVKDAAALPRVVQRIAAAGPSVYASVVNLCVEDADGSTGLTAALAAVFLEACKLPYTGCRSSTLQYPLDVLFMMLWYAEVPLPLFAIIDSAAAASRAATTLKAPLRICSAAPLLGQQEVLCTDQAAVEAALSHALAEHGRVVAWQINAAPQRAVRVCISGASVHTVRPMSAIPTMEATPAWWSAAEAAGQQCGAAVARHVLYSCGVASLVLDTLEGEEEDGRWCFQGLELNPPLADLLSTGSVGTLLAAMIKEGNGRHPAPTFEIRLHADSRKGYHLCAARALEKDAVVFADECRSFAMVTRPYVEQHWDATLKKTFTEYAWPLDTDGHLYAIWETDPQRWRPINHSCDPNCVFAAPHSLNVIAARDIAAGEDLSMDYVTFCDGTMKPFYCLCGAVCCRGTIAPDAAVLAKYNENSWLRGVPPPVKSLLPV